MPLSTHADEQINSFCDQLAPLSAAYAGHAALGFCALRRGDKWYLYSARLRLDHTKSTSTAMFPTATVMAGRYSFDTRARPLRELITSFLGTFSASGVSVQFEPEDSASYSAYVVPHHRSPGERSALATLKLQGRRNWENFDREEIGWHLRGSEMAFESLAELCAECDTGDEPGGFEVIAAPAVRILPTSHAQQTQATLMIACPEALEFDSCRLSYRVIHGSKVANRGSFTKRQLDWVRQDDLYVGTCRLTIPEGALVDCAVSYRGDTQQQAWITDRSAIGNPRRAAFERSDAELLAMQSLLCDDDDKNGRGFEAAVAWLFWILGFSPAHLRNSKHHEDAPDILIECEGGFVVVECTIGQLKADKRSNLKARCVAIEEGLAKSSNHDVPVLPLLVTRFNREQVSADLEDAAKAGLHVLTRDDLLVLLERTRQISSPAAIFSEWRNALDANRAASRPAPSPVF